MMKHIVLIAALFPPQLVAAADLRPSYRHRVVHHRQARPVVGENRVITCTTGRFIIFSYADCGQVFDPLAISTN